MLQRFGRCGRNKQPVIALIFVKKKHILPDSVDELEGSDFISLQSLIEITNIVEIQHIVSKLYKHNLQTICEKYLTSYH